MESIGKDPECAEFELGEVLAARSAAIANVDNVPGVGPPDLCWIQRTAKSIFNKKNPKTQGYYHWIVGLNVTSCASIAAYFSRLNASTKKMGYYRGMGVGRHFAIQRGLYCCYDPFSGMDIWVEVSLPGGATSRALDRQGYLHDVAAVIWKGAHVGCFLRAELYDVSVTLHCSVAFTHLAFLKTQDEEAELLDDVMELYKQNLAQTCTESLHWDNGQGTKPHHMDVLCNAVLEHFRKRRRWQKALQFFTELQTYFPSSAVYQSEIYKELDNTEAAAKVITSTLTELNKEAPSMLVLEFGYVSLENNKGSKAIQIANSVLEAEPQNRPAWLLLSRACLCQGLHSKSLKALQLMPAPVIHADRKIPVFRVLTPKSKFLSRAQTGYNPEVAELTLLFEESSKKGILMDSVPGDILAPRAQSHSSDFGLVSCTQCVMRAVYDILLDIVHRIGWEKFCEIRASIFILPNDEDGIGESERRLILLEFNIQETPFSGKVVSVTLNVQSSHPYEKPKRNRALYVRSMSGTSNQPETEIGRSLSLQPSNSIILANRVLEKGLGHVTKKKITSPSHSEEPASSVSYTPRARSKSPVRKGRQKRKTHRRNIPRNLTPTPRIHSEGPVSKNMTRLAELRTRIEVVTNPMRLSDEEEIPDAPENVLPTPLISSRSERGDRSPTSSTISQDRWQVKIVSMGIKDRVKYFETITQEKMAKQIPGTLSGGPFEKETCVSEMRPRRARYSFNQTIMEKLVQPPIPEPMPETENSDSSNETDGSEVGNWGSFALDEASCVPLGHSHPRSNLYDVFGSGAHSVNFSEGVITDLEDTKPCECAEWLDELILALWEDLATYADFKQLDRKLRSKNMQTHAEQILGTIEWNSDTSDEDDPSRTPTTGPSVPENRPVDWMRRGLLCERLRKLADAEQAYRVCVFQSFNLTSLMALSRIYSGWGYCKGSILMIHRMAQFHHKKQRTLKTSVIPNVFITHLSLLLESVGNKEVRTAIENCHPLVSFALEDVLKWKMALPSLRHDIEDE